MNLWEETVFCLEENGKSWLDVTDICGNDFKVDKENFKEVALNTECDPGYGSQVIASDLKIFGNNFVMIRLEYEGFERWEYINTKIDDNLETKKIYKLRDSFNPPIHTTIIEINEHYKKMEKYYEE